MIAIRLAGNPTLRDFLSSRDNCWSLQIPWDSGVSWPIRWLYAMGPARQQVLVITLLTGWFCFSFGGLVPLRAGFEELLCCQMEYMKLVRFATSPVACLWICSFCWPTILGGSPLRILLVIVHSRGRVLLELLVDRATRTLTIWFWVF